MSLSAEFDLPLTLMVMRVRGMLDSETTRRLFGVLRIAEPVTLPTPSEVAIVLQNTDLGGARALERRVREILPDAYFGLAIFQPGDEVSGLLERARNAAGAENL